MARLHRLSPFHLLVVVMLAVGVGATTAIFSLINGVLLLPLPFPDPQQLVLVGERAPQIAGSDNFAFFDTPSAYLAWQSQASAFQTIAALQNTSFTLTGEGEPRVLDGVRVTPNFFDVLQAKPELGRFFTDADASNEAEGTVLEQTTRDLIDVVLGVGGTYYLPYQLYYSPAQLRRAYPEIDAWFAAKRRFDPQGLFTNTFYKRYGDKPHADE